MSISTVVDSSWEQLDREALGELVNMAMGQAGSSLAKLFGRFVELSIPNVNIHSREALHSKVSQILPKGELWVATQPFHMHVGGESVVLAQHYVSSPLAELMGFDEGEVTDEEMLLELANLINGAFLGQLGNLLGVPVGFTPPTLLCNTSQRQNVASQLFPETAEWTHSLVMEVEFNLEGESLSLYLWLLLTEKCSQWLTTVVEEFFE